MNIHKWLPFLIILTFLIAAIEIYVLYHWTKFAKSRKFSKYTYILPWIISALVIIISLWLNIDRLFTSQIKIQYNILLIITSFWYLPKIVLLPFLIIKDLMKLLKYIVFSFRNKKNIAKSENKSSLKDIKRRDTIATIGWSMAVLPFGMAAYGILRTTITPQIHRLRLNLAGFPQNIESFRIVQISDIHAGSYYSPKQFREIRMIVNNLNPDLIVVTGDFVNFKMDELDIISSELSLLQAKYGVLGCLGNHDHYVGDENIPLFNKKMEECGIKMLNNSNHIIDTGMGKVQIAGVDNTGMSYQNYADFDKALSGLDESNAIIMLCHDPTNWDKSIVGKRKIDLTLSGHTHGGQFAVNVFGKEYSPAGWVYKQWAGLYQSKDSYLYVNRGVGMTGPPFRVGVNPEITAINLKAATDLA